MESQSEKLSNYLKGCKKDTTSQDRKDAVEALKISQSTLTNYLNGRVFDNDTGLKIFEFLNIKILKRDKIINRITN